MQNQVQTAAMAEVKRLQIKAGYDPSTGKFKSFEALVAEHQATFKCQKTEAIRFVRKQYPALHEAYIKETNAANA